MPQDPTTFEERVGSLIAEGQRWSVWVRSEPDDDGTWHNALLFRREGVLPPAQALVTGVEWHVPPGIALARALELAEIDQLELYQRALRPRPPLL